MTEHVLSISSQEPALVMVAGDGFSRPLPGITTETASPSIAELVEILGEASTMKLCDSFGGISRTIGRPAKAIVEAIGEDAAVKLRAYWGEGRIYIPRRATSWRARHDMVRRLAREGLTRHAIALRVKLTERQVYSILSRTAPALLAWPGFKLFAALTPIL